MSSNVGLNTPRGSGTSGYVQRNSANLKPRDNAQPYPKDIDSIQYRQRQPDQEILEHDRKREIEVKVFELRDKLEDEGVDDDEVDDRCDALRKKLENEQSRNGPSAKGLKSHQVHELARAKIDESEKLRKALGISKDYEEGSHWRKQEERKLDMERERGKGEIGRDRD
ncbi:pre-mRNA-splicing factor cwc21 like protein [Zymoseptoria brevis]|uniref:Pre-mRNA-splicing factor cwc21 like protein n=1 Tax=Zymoseptoria brevis TaxID=1047168 RepID=A0A0F4GET5_9PEZI|nr:pre-mRNA-splicing factor cwc21 like protein [Zymoseptoria brevis]